MQEEKDCIFCKIVRGEIPCEKIYETENVLVFLDVNPLIDGHALIIPKRHFTNLLDMPIFFSGEIIEVIKKIAHAQVKSLNAEGFSVLQRNFPAAGQVVMHLHFHVIPRFKGDSLKDFSAGKPAEKNKISEIAEQLKKEIK